MVAENIIYMLKTLNDEGFLTLNSGYEDIRSVLEEFDLENIANENFSNDVEY